MKSLYIRIYATIVAVLLLFAVGSGWIVQRHLDDERVRVEGVINDRLSAWAELIERSLPGADASSDVQASALREWSMRLRVPLALDDAAGRRIGASDSFERRTAEGLHAFSFKLDDGRTLWTMRPGLRQALNRGGGRGRPGDNADRPRGGGPRMFWPALPPGVPQGAGLAIVLVVLFAAVAAGAYPVVRRLTRRLESLRSGVDAFGAGNLGHRVTVSGGDEVAAVAASFNTAAARIETLVASHRSLLANASHELRSPLARMKMAVAMLEESPPAQRERLRAEIDRNVAELDALVEEVLLASRLDATADPVVREPIDLLDLAGSEAARVDAVVEQAASGRIVVRGDERLLRRALRNLLENGRRYGGGELTVTLSGGSAVGPAAATRISVCDRGPGVPEAMRDRIFEPFFRMPGHAEREGGVGLGLALVRQIAERHGGTARCEPRDGGGSCFTIELPADPAAAASARSGAPP